MQYQRIGSPNALLTAADLHQLRSPHDVPLAATKDLLPLLSRLTYHHSASAAGAWYT